MTHMSNPTPDDLYALTRARSLGIAGACRTAGELAAKMVALDGIAAADVTVALDEDGDPVATFAFDATLPAPEGAVNPDALADALARAAARCDLVETTGEARSFREWEGEVDGLEVALVLYLDVAPTLADRIRRVVVGQPGWVPVAAVAAAGAVAGLASRRAVLALVR